jgi:hypothetical protein
VQTRRLHAEQVQGQILLFFGGFALIKCGFYLLGLVPEPAGEMQEAREPNAER